ncbi:hypothetical protein CEXT_475261 [Caerostris extrusa]|uniref:Uncharacterized protein n=1 Tax=Caerostris extrusa TaxID=172846 RepID=A0AAV4SYX1_CAEEX|nr:hypothetical protein CEXT_475261 [Caerostris extrusa]
MTHESIGHKGIRSVVIMESFSDSLHFCGPIPPSDSLPSPNDRIVFAAAHLLAFPPNRSRIQLSLLKNLRDKKKDQQFIDISNHCYS